MSVSIKTVLDENIHRFTLALVSFEELERALFTIYGKGVFAIRYRDEDGDLISVSSTPELQEALRGANGKTLKLLLSRGEEKAKKGGVEAKSRAEVANSEQQQQQQQFSEQTLKEEQMMKEVDAQLTALYEQYKQIDVEAQHMLEQQRLEQERILLERQQQQQQQLKEQAEAQALADAQLLEQYQKDLEAAQQELRAAAEASREAKSAAVQAFWEAEEAREKALKEKRDREATSVVFARPDEEASMHELIERLAVESVFDAEKLVKSASGCAAERQAKAQAFWDAESVREQAQQQAREAEEAKCVVERACEESQHSSSDVIHANVQCNGCDVYPIVGTRYQCTVCADFDLCEKCESSHPSSHALLKHKQRVNVATVHRGVACDNCNMYPIVGARFKCKVCPNFDLCEACESKDVHPADHPLFKFRLERERRCGLGGLQRGPLSIGVSGPRVRRLQERLGVNADGVFGPQTEQAVKEFQAQNGLSADGVVGLQTRKKLRHSSDLFHPCR